MIRAGVAFGSGTNNRREGKEREREGDILSSAAIFSHFRRLKS